MSDYYEHSIPNAAKTIVLNLNAWSSIDPQYNGERTSLIEPRKFAQLGTHQTLADIVQTMDKLKVGSNPIHMRPDVRLFTSACCSALGDPHPRDKDYNPPVCAAVVHPLTMRGSPREIRAVTWQWLAYAFFRADACSSIHTLELTALPSLRDIKAMATIVHSRHPAKELYFPEFIHTSSTNMHLHQPFTDKRIYEVYLAEETPMIMPSIARNAALSHTSLHVPYRGYYSIMGNRPASDWIEILVPGDGQCSVRRSSIIQVRQIDDKGMEDEEERNASSPSFGISHSITRLSLKTSTSDDLVAQRTVTLLELIGAPLESLELDVDLRRQANNLETMRGTLRAIFQACPKLRRLRLHYVNDDSIQAIMDGYQNGICNLNALDLGIFYDNYLQIRTFATALEDSTSPITRKLTHLSVHIRTPYREHDEDIAWDFALMLKTNLRLLFFGFHASRNVIDTIRCIYVHTNGKEVVVPAPLGLKLSFLSVVQRRESSQNAAESDRVCAVNKLDDHIVGLILQFAGSIWSRRVDIADEDH